MLADELGLDSVWVAEAWGQDAVSVLGLLAGKTERVALGSGLLQIPARAPAATAMAAATLDVLSGGRFRLGLGVSGPQVSEGWYGVPFARPVSRTREYVEIVRTALARKTLVHEGREYRVPLEGAKPLKLLAKPVQERIPVYLGAVGPKAVEQVGEIADGWLPFMLEPRARRARCSSRWTAGSRRPAARARTSTSRPAPRWPSRRTSTRRATPCARGWPSTSARWARGRRTSTSSWPSARATARPRASARSVPRRRPRARRRRADARA